MKVKELITLLNYCERNKEVRFTDVCGNWEFELYELSEDDGKIYIVGDETRE